MNESVCLSAPKNKAKLHQFFACCLWPWLCPPALRYAMYFQCCGWRCFSQHWVNRPELNMTLYFNKVCQVAAPVGRQTINVSLSLSESGTRAKSAIYNCLIIIVSYFQSVYQTVYCSNATNLTCTKSGNLTCTDCDSELPGQEVVSLKQHFLCTVSRQSECAHCTANLISNKHYVINIQNQKWQ